ncbi:hypothetical protein AAF712_010188 [Marasmius tenuissimus]|uniref:Uncharacterized protein n=1 Tax=Marasmius tenuissimus TaxID=585030 RepID=A0ABR2ZPC2_9AGAR
MSRVSQTYTGTPTISSRLPPSLAGDSMPQSSPPKPPHRASVSVARALPFNPPRSDMPQCVRRASAPPVAHSLPPNPAHMTPKYIRRASVPATPSTPIHEARGSADPPSSRPIHKATKSRPQTSSEVAPVAVQGAGGDATRTKAPRSSKNQVQVLEPIIEEAEESKPKRKLLPGRQVGNKYTFSKDQVDILTKLISLWKSASKGGREHAARVLYDQLSPIDIFAVPEKKTPEQWKYSLMRWFGNNKNKGNSSNNDGSEETGTKPKPKKGVSEQAQEKDNSPRMRSLVRFFNKLTGNALEVVTGREIYGEAHAELLKRTMRENNDSDYERVLNKFWDKLEPETKDHWEQKAMEEVPVSSNQDMFCKGLRAIAQACVRSGYLGQCGVGIVFAFPKDGSMDGTQTAIVNDWWTPKADIPQDDVDAIGESLANAFHENLLKAVELDALDSLKLQTKIPVDDDNNPRFPEVDLEDLKTGEGRIMLHDWFTTIWVKSGREGPIRYNDISESPHLFYDNQDLPKDLKICDPTSANSMGRNDVGDLVAHFAVTFGARGRVFSFLPPRIPASKDQQMRDKENNRNEEQEDSGHNNRLDENENENEHENEHEHEHENEGENEHKHEHKRENENENENENHHNHHEDHHEDWNHHHEYDEDEDENHNNHSEQIDEHELGHEYDGRYSDADSLFDGELDEDSNVEDSGDERQEGEWGGIGNKAANDVDAEGETYMEGDTRVEGDESGYMEEVREEAEAGRVEEVEEGVEAGRMEEVGEEPEAGRMRGEANVCVAGGDHGRSDGNPERAPSKSDTKSDEEQGYSTYKTYSRGKFNRHDRSRSKPKRPTKEEKGGDPVAIPFHDETKPDGSECDCPQCPRSTRQSAVASTMFISGMYSASGRPVSQTRRDGQAPTGNSKPANSQSKKGIKRI